MSTATATHEIITEHIKRFDTKVTGLRRSYAELSSDDTLERLLKIIHQPGWTTPAESIFFEAIVDTIAQQVAQLNTLHKQLLAGAERVGGR